MVAALRWASVALDCEAPEGLAEFWARLLGGEVAFRSDAMCAVSTPEGLYLAMVRVRDHRPPDWPGDSVPKQIHLDLSVDDLDDAEAVAREAGAVPAASQPAPDRWRVMLDPAGHPFCLSVQIPDRPRPE